MPANFRRQALKKVTEATKRFDSIKWEEFTEDTIHASWMTQQFNKFPKLNTNQIGGQDPDSGPDVIKFLKKHDPQISSGPVKKALDIMEAAQKAAESDKLMDFIKPVKQVLGAGLFGALQQAAAASKAAHKVAQAQQQQQQQQQPDKDIIAELIAAALAMCTPEEALLVAELLDDTEVALIREAFYGNGIYKSAKPDMPQTFIDAINYLIPIFRIKEGIEPGIGAAVS